MLGERLGTRFGNRILAPLLVLGALSVVWWRVSEASGAGDLRWYAIVQFAPIVVLPMVLALTPQRGIGGADLSIVVAGYTLSKLLEWQDQRVLTLIGISGHTLKHVAAAFSCLWVARALARTSDARPVRDDRSPDRSAAS